MHKVSYNKVTECWEWDLTKSDYKKGPSFSDKNKRYSAAQWIYIYYKKIIPKECKLWRTCDNKRCVSPNHLKPLHHKGYHAQLGTKSHKLKQADIYKIIEYAYQEKWPTTHIAELFNVSETAIRKVLKKHKTMTPITQREDEFDSFL